MEFFIPWIKQQWFTSPKKYGGLVRENHGVSHQHLKVFYKGIFSINIHKSIINNHQASNSIGHQYLKIHIFTILKGRQSSTAHVQVTDPAPTPAPTPEAEPDSFFRQLRVISKKTSWLGGFKAFFSFQN